MYKNGPLKRSSTFNFCITLCSVILFIIYFNPEIMDCVGAATDLKKLLIAHSNAENQVSVLGKSTPCLYCLIV